MFVSDARERIRQLVEAGFAPRSIARQLNLAPATVDYHVTRLSDPAGMPEAAPSEPPCPPSATVPTRARIAALLAAGLTRAEIARRVGVSKATVSYHARRLGEQVNERCARRYDWGAIQRFYDEGHSVRECIATFGFSSASWASAVKRGAVRARPSSTPIDELLVADTYRGRYHLKLRLLREGLKQNRCERCGVVEWRGLPLTLALHHVNGVRNDNRLENLELLCPNCHSQTDTFAGRKRSGLTSAPV